MSEGPTVGRRQKLRRMEVLRAADKEARTREWFEGKVPNGDMNREDRGQATRDLLDIGLLEKDDLYPQARHPHPYRLTALAKAAVLTGNALRRLNFLHWSIPSPQKMYRQECLWENVPSLRG